MLNTHNPPLPSQILVWDLFVRVFHWLFAAGILAELALGFLVLPEGLQLHAWIGYTLLALVALRLVWGLAGSGYARFSTFPPSPRAALNHLKGRSPHTPGHNPLGAIMVYALLGLALVMILTGIAALGGLERQGVAANLAVETGENARQLHEIGSYLFAVLIAAHWIGVAISSRQEKQNLAKAMITGRKTGSGPSPRYLKSVSPMLMLASTGAIAAIGIGSYLALESLPRPRTPSALHPAIWVEECGACHTPHHPSLLPAVSWAQIMANLYDHFGEDASLPEAAAREIGDWLAANSSENFDTKAAVWFGTPDTAEPPRITASARWQDIHEDLPAEMFKRTKVASKANCGACHTDADTGRFALSAISIPAP